MKKIIKDKMHIKEIKRKKTCKEYQKELEMKSNILILREKKCNISRWTELLMPEIE